MQNYFIPHKLKEGDLTHLSDENSELIISKNLHKVEEPVEISTLESVFLARVTHIDKASVEVEIIEKLEDRKAKENPFHITLIQSITSDQKLNFVLEKSVEIGVNRIILVESKYSTQSKNKCIKKFGMYKKILKEAKEQSRNPYDMDFEKPVRLKDVTGIDSKYKICLSTEVTTSTLLKQVLKEKDPKSSYTIAIGPEKGWSSSDLKFFSELGFEFTKMGKNILRTETGGLVISSILNFKAGIY